jgi:hypothetical protein
LSVAGLIAGVFLGVCIGLNWPVSLTSLPVKSDAQEALCWNELGTLKVKCSELESVRSSATALNTDLESQAAQLNIDLAAAVSHSVEIQGSLDRATARNSELESRAAQLNIDLAAAASLCAELKSDLGDASARNTDLASQAELCCFERDSLKSQIADSKICPRASSGFTTIGGYLIDVYKSIDLGIQSISAEAVRSLSFIAQTIPSRSFFAQSSQRLSAETVQLPNAAVHVNATFLYRHIMPLVIAVAAAALLGWCFCWRAGSASKSHSPRGDPEIPNTLPARSAAASVSPRSGSLISATSSGAHVDSTNAPITSGYVATASKPALEVRVLLISGYFALLNCSCCT